MIVFFSAAPGFLKRVHTGCNEQSDNPSQHHPQNRTMPCQIIPRASKDYKNTSWLVSVIKALAKCSVVICPRKVHVPDCNPQALFQHQLHQQNYRSSMPHLPNMILSPSFAMRRGMHYNHFLPLLLNNWFPHTSTHNIYKNKSPEFMQFKHSIIRNAGQGQIKKTTIVIPPAANANFKHHTGALKAWKATLRTTISATTCQEQIVAGWRSNHFFVRKVVLSWG